jgi:UDP-N-acetyl-2-amino-2-deoxyglucuronate dehydrogenase
MNKIKFGLIGCGRISSQHLKSIEKYSSQAEVLEVCDIIPQLAKKTAKKYKVDNWCTDYKELLKRKDIDIISVCTPNGLHKKMAIDIANSEKHALVEKPLALKTSDIEEMVNTFREKRKKLFAVLQVRYNPPLMFMKKFISKRRLGTILYVTQTIRWYRPKEYFQDTWRGTKKSDGGALLNQGIHYLDAMQWILGGVKSVEFSKVLNLCHKIEIEDSVFTYLKLNSSAICNLEFTLCNFPKNSECSLNIIGTKGNIKIGGAALNEITAWNVPGVKKPKIRKSINPNIYANGLYQGSCPYHFLVYKDLINHLNKKKKVLSIDGSEAKKSVQIIEAIYKSSKTGKKVSLYD